MNTIARWLTEDGNIVVPKTLDTQVFDENGKSLNRRLKTAKDEQIIQLPKVDPSMIFSDLDYSTEEQLTGRRWIDGKPIYQKTVVIDTPSVTGTDIRYPHGIENVDEIIDGKTKYIRSDGVSYTEPIYIGNSSVRACAFDATDIIITLQSMNISTIKVTIFYTKTTDTVSSPVALPKVEALHVYSTEEKVVGTWIDGQKIYEKTWKIDNTTATSNWDVTNADFENIAFVVEATLYDTDSETPRSVPVKTRKLSSTSIRFYTGDSWLSIDAYTIQYVKTTATTT